ncbi:TPA: hypothetical protein ACGO0F_002033 [Streptococcus suis]
MDKLYSILNRANDWIDRHLPYFYTTEKAFLELNQLYLFDKVLNREALKININFYKKEYGSIEEILSSDTVYYRKIEYLSLLFLEQKEDALYTHIQNIFKDGFLVKLCQGMIPLDIITNRDYLYAVTHDVFYTSLFGRTVANFETYIDFTNLSMIIEQGMLLSISRDDIDVLMELLCVAYLLKLAIPSYLMKVVEVYLEQKQAEDGFFYTYNSNEQISNVFLEVYHTCLVAGILLRILKNDS